MKKYFYILITVITLFSCSTTKEVTTTNYPNKTDIAILTIESKDVAKNFTYFKNGLKVTYDFWGETTLIILENISDSIIFIDLNNSYITTGKEKLNYNKMIKGSFNILPLLPDSTVDLHNFFTINNDNVDKLNQRIKEISNYKYKQKYFKKNECPINITNTVKFSVKSANSYKFTITNNFYSSKINIVTKTQFYELQQYNKKLYNKTFYNKSDYEQQNDLSWKKISKDILVEAVYTFVELAITVISSLH